MEVSVRHALRSLATVALLVGAAGLEGADSARDALDACRNIVGDADRLACYDGIPVQTTPATPDVSRTAVTSAPSTSPDVRPSAPVPPATQAAPEDGNVVQRGLLRLRGLFGRDDQPAKQPVELQSIEGQVVKVTKLARGNHSITLEDGQVWRENEVEPRARYRVGDTVVIARGVFGSYNLSNERTGHRVKVRRIR